MNELENQLSEVLKKAIEIAEKSGEFVIDQAPLLLQEFYAWHIAKSAYGMFIGLVVFMLINFVRNYIGKKEAFEHIENQGYHDEEKTTSVKKYGRYFKHNSEVHFFRPVLRILSLVILLVVSSIYIFDIVYILIAPKLYLLEYFIK